MTFPACQAKLYRLVSKKTLNVKVRTEARREAILAAAKDVFEEVGFEQAKKAAGVSFESHVYPGTQHGFHNNSPPRYSEAAAKLSWERTIAFFKKNLA